MNQLEMIAVALGVANIALIIRRSIWNYPVGIAMVALYALIFWDVKLYSDAALQLFFIGAQAYGWIAWARASGAMGDIVVERLDTRGRLRWGGAMLAGAAALGWAMHRFTDASLPYWDALVAAPSVAAQLMLARRYLENWVVWIAVDVVAIGLYATKGLLPTAALYAGFLVLAAVGLATWRRVEAAQRAG
ncbi:nicotinamide riboside transporter PnuC [Sphingomonas sp.]|uniref:nicotinamide riboside transporter PnuC n=1 Tax=Sphingomonas sp. TaxID=28214 RepID=UPI002DD64D40|nr:nicotinamide riboside transporter PnuC [Sphingomonas sp.]